MQGIQVAISVQSQNLVDDTTCREICEWYSNGNSIAATGSKTRVCPWGWVFFWLRRANGREHFLHSLLACVGWRVSRNSAGNCIKWAPILHWKWLALHSSFSLMFYFMCKKKEWKKNTIHDQFINYHPWLSCLTLIVIYDFWMLQEMLKFKLPNHLRQYL